MTLVIFKRVDETLFCHGSLTDPWPQNESPRLLGIF